MVLLCLTNDELDAAGRISFMLLFLSLFDHRCCLVSFGSDWQFIMMANCWSL